MKADFWRIMGTGMERKTWDVIDKKSFDCWEIVWYLGS